MNTSWDPTAEPGIAGTRFIQMCKSFPQTHLLAGYTQWKQKPRNRNMYGRVSGTKEERKVWRKK
jgi:hypothetical protein